MNKTFDECVLVDTFTLVSGVAASTLPLQQTATIPVLIRNDIKYIRIKSISIISDAATTVAGILSIKCSIVASSDKTIATVALEGGAIEKYNYNLDQIIKVAPPLNSNLVLEYTADTPGKTYNGTVALFIECYA